MTWTPPSKEYWKERKYQVKQLTPVLDKLALIIPDLKENLLQEDYDSGDECVLNELNYYGSDIVNGSELEIKKALKKMEWINRYISKNKYGNVILDPDTEVLRVDKEILQNKRIEKNNRLKKKELDVIDREINKYSSKDQKRLLTVNDEIHDCKRNDTSANKLALRRVYREKLLLLEKEKRENFDEKLSILLARKEALENGYFD
jgi:hypothetical protein